MPDINGNYLDTSRSKVKASYTDKDVKKPSLAGLYDAAAQAKSEKENYLQGMARGGAFDPKDTQIALADKTLQDADQQTGYSDLKHEMNDQRNFREPLSRSMADRVVGSAFEPSWGGMSPVDAAATVGSFLAPEIAIPADAYFGTQAAGQLIGNGTQGMKEHPIQSAFQALAAMSGPLRLSRFNKVTPGAVTNFAKDAGGLSDVGREISQAGQSLDKQSSIPPVRHYWDALDLGQEPGQALKIASGRDKGAKTALEALQRAGNGSEGVAGDAAKTVPTPETPARSMPTDPRADFGSAHSTPGVDANTVMDDSGRVLGSNPFYSADALSHPGSLKYQTEQYAQNHPLAVSLLGDRVRTPEEIAQRLSSENPLAWKPDMVDMPNGSTVPGGNGGTPHPGAGMDNQSLRALRDAAQARYTKQVEGVIPSNLTKDPAQEAILYGGETGSPLFGGASAREAGNGPKAGKFVRPSKRTPIGKGKK